MKLFCKQVLLYAFSTALLLVASAFPVYAALFEPAPPQPVQLTVVSKPDEAFQLLVDDGNMFRHITKQYAGKSSAVAIGTVRLNFVTDAATTATAKAFMGKATVSQSAQMKLVGVTPETMQAIANDFHAALRKKLAEQGYEVVPQMKLLEIPEYKAAVAETKPVDNSFTGSVISVYAESTGNIRSFGMRNFSYYQKMPVVIADITLNFAVFDKATDRWASGNTIKASVTAKAVSTCSGSMSLMTEDGGGGRFDFVRPLILPGQIAASVDPIAKSGGEVAGAVVIGILGALTNSSSATASYQVAALPNYREVMISDMGLLAGVVANVLKKR